MKKYMGLLLMSVYAVHAIDTVQSNLVLKATEYLNKQSHDVPEAIWPFVEQARLFDPHTSLVTVRNFLYTLQKTNQFSHPCTSALLTCSLVPTIAHVKRVTIALLSDIDDYLRYWHFQQAHSQSYFFHKSPTKWFSGLPQEAEISKHVKMLRACQQEHYNALGMLIVHEDLFNPCATPAQQYEWLCRAMHILNVLCMGKCTIQQKPDPERCIALLRDATRLVHTHESRIQGIISSAKPPHVLIQNWIKYSAYLAASGLISRHLYNNKEPYKQKALNLYNGGKSFFENQLKQAHDAFFEPYDAAAEASLTDHYRRVIYAYKEDLFLNGLTDPQITKAASEHDISLVENRLIPEYTERVRQSKEGATVWNGYNAAEVTGLLKSAPDLGLLYARLIKERYFKQNKIILGVLSLIPVGGVAAGGYYTIRAILNRFRTVPDYTPLRLSLIDIGHVLNTYGDAAPKEMAAEDFGKLVYLVEKLEREHYLVDQQYRERFLQDINRLRSPQLSVQRKMKVIDFMHKTYEFLMPHYEHA